MVLYRNVKLYTVQRQCILVSIASFYTFALLNVLNWARTGSFTQSLSAADLYFGSEFNKVSSGALYG
jgi:hypothetical protein